MSAPWSLSLCDLPHLPSLSTVTVSYSPRAIFQQAVVPLTFHSSASQYRVMVPAINVHVHLYCVCCIC